MMNEQILGIMLAPSVVKRLAATHRHITANRMTQWKRKMLPMPRPKHSTILMIPALLYRVSGCDCCTCRVVDPTIDRIYLVASQRVCLAACLNVCDLLKLRDRSSSAIVILSVWQMLRLVDYVVSRRRGLYGKVDSEAVSFGIGAEWLGPSCCVRTVREMV